MPSTRIASSFRPARKNRAKGSRPKGSLPKGKFFFWPKLEILEDRTVPTTLTVNAGDTATLIGDISLANAHSSASNPYEIDLTFNASIPYTFSSANNSTDGSNVLPVLTAADLTIVGNGATLNAGSKGRFFDVASGASLTLENMTLTGGMAFGSGTAAEGGAIYSSGGLTLSGVTVSTNVAEGIFGEIEGFHWSRYPAAAAGGGLYVAGGTATLNNNTTVSSNKAVGGSGGSNGTGQFNAVGGSGAAASGGGLYVATGTVTLSNATLSANQAVGGNGDHAADYNTFDGSGGAAYGGGLYVAAGNVTLTADALSSNVAQGGFGALGGYNGTQVTGNGTVGGAASGGGLYVAGGIVALNSSALNSNTAQGGGGGAGLSKTSLGGMGGSGGAGSGGGLFAAGATLSLNSDTVSSNIARGGNGGYGGNVEGFFGHGGLGGSGGPGSGGALNVAAGTVTLTDNTALSSNQAVGGMGGAGGYGIYNGWYGGSGGPGSGGGVNVSGGGVMLSYLANFSGNQAIGGGAGTGGGGSIKSGLGGNAGAGSGGGLCVEAGTVSLNTVALSSNAAQGGAGGTGGSYNVNPYYNFNSGGNGNNATGGGLSLSAGVTVEGFSTTISMNTVTAGAGGYGNPDGSPGTASFADIAADSPGYGTYILPSPIVVSSASPSVFGQPLTFTAQIYPQPQGSATPSGTVTFLDGGVIIGTSMLSSGAATLTPGSLSPGTYTISAIYSGDSNYQGSSTPTFTQTVNQGASSTTVTTSAPENLAVFGQLLTFTATVAATAPATGTPTGIVTFLDGGVSIGTGTLSGGTATFTTSSLSLGTHKITVTYSGDADYTTSTSVNLPQTVNAAYTAATVTSSSSNSSAFGQSVTFTATVTADAPSTATVNTGTVQFLIDGVAFGSPVSVNSSGIAVSSPTSGTQLLVGTHTIDAVYSGGSNFNSSSTTSYSASVLSASPTAYYPLNELTNTGEPTTALDASGNGSDAAYWNGFTLGVPGPVAGSTAVQLDGSTGYVNLPAAPFGNYPTGGATTNYSLTFEIWFNAAAGSNGGVILGMYDSSSVAVPAVMLGTDGKIYSSLFWFGSSSDVITSRSAYNDGQWHLVDATYAKGTQSLYIDNVLIGTQSFAEVGATPPDYFYLGTGYTGGWPGGNGGYSYFNGRLAQAAVYPTALSATQIAAHFSADSAHSLIQTVNGPYTTTTTVVSSNNASVFGQSVTLTATVSTTPGAGTPTGTVTFLDGGVSIGTGTLAGGTATLTTASLPVATHTITVAYSGDSDFAGSSSPALSQTVNQGGTFVTLASALNPSVPGQSVTFTAVVSASSPAAGTPTGTVTFLDGGVSIGTGTLAGGTATLTTASLPVATHTITVAYSGDSDFAGSSSPVLSQTVNQGATSTTASSTANPAVFGQSVTFTALVSVSAPAAGTPTGIVTFLDGGVSIGTGTLSGGTATFTTSSLSLGTHTITVTYSGDASFTTSTSANLPQTVNAANTTTTVVSSSLNPSVFGQSVSFTADVTANAPSTATVNTGTVQFLIDGVAFGSPVSVNSSGIAVSSPTSGTQLSGGTHTISATFSGGSNFTSSTIGSYSATVLSASPTSYYPLNEASGTTAQDDSGYGSNATYNGGVTLGLPGPVVGSSAVKLDGSTGYVSLPAAPFGNYPTSGSTTNYALTFEVWFNAAVGSNGGVILGQTGGGYVPAVMLGTDGKIRSSLFWLGSVSHVITSASTYNDGQWHLVDGTYANGTQSLYIDNVLIGTQSFAETAYNSSYSYTLGTGYTGGWTGGNGGQFYFNGRLALAAIYPAALSATQIAAHFSAASVATPLIQTVNGASTTATVVASTNLSVYGQSVTFTATVSTTPGLGTPTGTVAFLDNGVSIGTGTLSGGVATFTTSSLPAGTHTITAAYGGDTNFAASTSSNLLQTVNPDNSSTSLTSSLNASVFGQTVTFTATVSPASASTTPTGTVTFLDGGVSIGTAALAGGIGTFTTSSLSVGTHTITAAYGGDSNFISSSSAALGEQVDQGATSTSVTTSANPSVVGIALTLTATVKASAPAAGTPSGTVTFFDAGVSLGTGTLSGGSASIATSSLTVGTHLITAVYTGDNNFLGSSSAAFSQSVSSTISTPAQLIEAINSANITSATISLPPNVTFDFTTADNSTNGANALPVITGNVTIIGSSDTLERTAGLPAFRLFDVAPGGSLTLENLTLTGGLAQGTGVAAYGGAIYSAGTLTLSGVTLQSNVAQGSQDGYGGGGPSNGGNGANAYGGALYVAGGAATLNGDIFNLNQALAGNGGNGFSGYNAGNGGTGGLASGGGLYVAGGNVTLSNATLVNNAAVAGSGGNGGNGRSTFGSYGNNGNGGNGGSATGGGLYVLAGLTVLGDSVTTISNNSVTPGAGGSPGRGVRALGGSSGSAGTATFADVAANGPGLGNYEVTQSATATSTAVVSSVNPSVFGQAITFTATVSPTSGTGTPTGTVTFLDGGTTLGTGTLSGGVATFVASRLSVGDHTITVSYGGDANFSGSNSTAVTQTVNLAGTTSNVSSSLDASAYGQSVTFTATVSADSPSAATVDTGSVQFLIDGVDFGAPVSVNASGVATSGAIATLGAGPHTIEADYSDGANFHSSSASMTQIVNKANPTILVTPFNVTYDGNAHTASGSATGVFGESLAGLDLSGTTRTNAGAYNDTWTFTDATGNYNNASGTVSDSIAQANTTTSIVSSVNPSVFGQSITFTATVQPTSGSGTPTGTVTFTDNGKPLGSATLSGSVGTLTTSGLAKGTQSIAVIYGGDGNFGSSTSANLSQTVTKDGSTVAVASSVNPSVFGQTVTFTATVSAATPGSGVPTGTVTFKNGSATLGTATLSGGTATFATSSLGTGGHSITVSYSGDGNFKPSTSAKLTQTVNKTNTATIVVSSFNPSTFGQAVTFTATVSPVVPGGGISTGTVHFYDGKKILGTADLSGGMAQFTTSNLKAGNHLITAKYAGDANDAASTSSQLTQTVNSASNPSSVLGSALPPAEPNPASSKDSSDRPERHSVPSDVLSSELIADAVFSNATLSQETTNRLPAADRSQDPTWLDAFYSFGAFDVPPG